MNGSAFTTAWLIPILPLLSFLLLGLVVGPRTRKAGAIVGTVLIGITALLAYRLAWAYHGLAGEGEVSFVAAGIEWLQYQPGMKVTMGVLVDPISVLLLVVVTTVSLLVHIYSIGYMDDDPSINRYFTFLSLFTFSMLGLVVAPNIMQIFVFWELVGVSSFLLIGFYYTRPDAMAASKKAFIVTRFADLFFVIGILILGYHGYQLFQDPAVAIQFASNAQPFDFAVLTHPAITGPLSLMPGVGGYNLLSVALLLVFIGAAGKSAMFPLHVWLPDAMAGPTPVSALIHAATMVVAGVYLVARLFPAYAASQVLTLIGGIGAFTCLFAAVIACNQSDIKRVLAFSTLSQLGYMMFALGVASLAHPDGYAASMFHLFTHAFFKALLFLGAGSVIHAVHSNEIWDMGGLRKRMPVTHATFLIATIAIAGVWPLAGFWSKDAILLAAYDSHHMLIFGTGLLVAGLTAFYMFRLYIVTFLGAARGKGAGHAHEAPVSMLVPLCILAVLSVVAGFIPVAEFVSIAAEKGAEHHSSAHTLVAVLSTIAAGCGIGAAFYLYLQETRAAAVARSLGGLYTLVQQKFYVDAVYLGGTRLIFNYVSRPFAWFDRHVVDHSLDLTAAYMRRIGKMCNAAQTGQVQSYGLWLLNGVVVLLLYFWFVH